MPQVTLYANKSALVKPGAPTTNFSTGSEETLLDTALNAAYLLAGFAAMAAELQYKKISAISACAYMTPGGSWCSPVIDALTAGFVESEATYATAPGTTDTNYGSSIYAAGYAATQLHDLRALTNGVQIGSGSTFASVQTSRGVNKPYLQVDYEDTDVTGVISGCAPASGYVPKGKANTFSWALTKSGWCYGDITQASAAFRWRAGTEGTGTAVACGTAQSCTLPAGTFSTDTVQWQVEILTNTGETLTSGWYTLSTAEAASTAAITAPKDDLIDGTGECAVSWQHIISTGTAPTGYELQQSADGSAWAALKTDAASAATSYTVPAGSFAAGDLYLRVRTYNQDGAAGAWSDAVHDIVVAAPAAPAVSVDAAPRPTVRWSAAGQQAYEVSVDGVSSGLRFGVGTSYKWPDYLDDGSHTAAVRVQNKYGLWSGWTAAAFTAANTAGAAITLTVTAAHFAALSWETSGAYDAYLIYRDGKLIGKAAGKSYADALSIGQCVYQVRGVYAAGENYGLSGRVSARVTCETVMLYDLATGAWMTLLRTAESDRVNRLSHSRDVTYINCLGSEYPMAEISPYRYKAYSFAAAFTAAETAAIRQFEALIGRLVCLKDRWGNLVIGILAAQNVESTRFYEAYTVTVRQVRYTEGAEW